MEKFLDQHTIDDLAHGCSVEIDLEIPVTFYPAEGDGWNSPRIPAHYEADGYLRVTTVRFYHYNGDWTEVQIGQGSILESYFLELLPDNTEERILQQSEPVIAC